MARAWEGVSAYPAGAWDKRTVNQYFRCMEGVRRPATSVLWGTWSNKRLVTFVDRFIRWAGDRPHLVEIHMSNECARRTGRAGGQIAPGLNRQAYNAALNRGWRSPEPLHSQVEKRVRAIVNKIKPLVNEKTTIIISVGLEDNLGGTAAATLLTWVRRMLDDSGCEDWYVVRNPMTRKGRIESEWIEGHGRTFHPGSQEVWNFDGLHVGSHSTVEDIGYDNALKAIKAANKQYRVVYLWSAIAQGYKRPGMDYDGRTYEITDTEVNGFNHILREAQR